MFLLLPLLVTYIYCLKTFTLKLNNFTWICLRVCHLLLFSSSTVTSLFFIILPSFTLKMIFQLMSLNGFLISFILLFSSDVVVPGILDLYWISFNPYLYVLSLRFHVQLKKNWFSMSWVGFSTVSFILFTTSKYFKVL